MTKIHTILTHPGSAHKDEFLACCVLAHIHGAPIVRRDPTADDLADAEIAVVDIGGSHAPELSNFDHHQFPRDSTPLCALSLVLKHLGLYEDAKQFCDWLEPAEWFDCRGAVDTAKWLGVERHVMNRLNSPIDVTLLRRFACSKSLDSNSPLWQIMSFIGEDLIEYLTGLRKRLSFIKEHAEFWTVKTPEGQFDALFMPRTDPLPEEPSVGLPRFIEDSQRERPVIAMVYPDRRGDGYGLSRHKDNQRMEFTRVADCEDVHFAHARGFIAKTSSTSPERLRELLAQAYQG